MIIPKVNNIIFDFDGVIADTDKGRFILLKDILQSYGVNIEDKNKINDLEGISTLKFLKLFYPEISEFHKEIIDKRHNLYLTNLDKYCIPFPDAVRVISNLSSKYNLHLATTNTIEIANKLLHHLTVDKYFDNVFGRNITENKEYTKSYKQTLLELNINSNECIVIEDSQIGINAAKNENIFCIGYNSNSNKLIDKIADISVINFNDIEKILM